MVITIRSLLIELSADILDYSSLFIPVGTTLPILDTLEDRIISEFEGKKIALFPEDYSLLD